MMRGGRFYPPSHSFILHFDVCMYERDNKKVNSSMFPNGVSSPRSNANHTVTFTINYLAQITEKLFTYPDELLQRLDEQIVKYVDARNQQRRPILEDLSEQTLTIDNLNIANLNILHNETQCAVLSLDEMMSDFNKTREIIQDINNRTLREFMTGPAPVSLLPPLTERNNEGQEEGKTNAGSQETQIQGQQDQQAHEGSNSTQDRNKDDKKTVPSTTYIPALNIKNYNQVQDHQRTLLDVIKDLTLELSRFRDVQQIITDVQNIKKRNKQRGIGDDDEQGEMIEQIHRYIDRLNEIMGSDLEEDQQQHYYNEEYRGYYDDDHNESHSLSVSQLQFVQ